MEIQEMERMSDILDLASDFEERVKTDSVTSIRAAAANIPAGEAGDCHSCGEYFARLVGGKCGFCRDGRRRLGTAEAVIV